MKLEGFRYSQIPDSDTGEGFRYRRNSLSKLLGVITLGQWRHRPRHFKRSDISNAQTFQTLSYHTDVVRGRCLSYIPLPVTVGGCAITPSPVKSLKIVKKIKNCDLYFPPFKFFTSRNF